MQQLLAQTRLFRGSGPAACTGLLFEEEQRRDSDAQEITRFMEDEELPLDSKRATKIATQQSLFTLVDKILCYIDPKTSGGTTPPDWADIGANLYI